MTNRVNQFAVKFEPDYEMNQKSGWKMPTRIEWLTAKDGITKSMDLPKLIDPKPDDFGDKLATLLMPPAVPIYIAERENRIWDLLRVIPGILCVIVGWRLGRRYSFPGKAQAGWGVFHLLFGLPGLLAFLSVQEWPARETCPSCKKPRVVDREKCPHCGAAFAPPEKNGTEIFEPLAAD